MCLGALRGEHSLKVAGRARAGQTFPPSVGFWDDGGRVKPSSPSPARNSPRTSCRQGPPYRSPHRTCPGVGVGGPTSCSARYACARSSGGTPGDRSLAPWRESRRPKGPCGRCSVGWRGRARLHLVQLDKMLQMGIPFLLFTLTWQNVRPELVIMAKRDMKFEIAVVHAQNTQKTHISHAPFGNIETAAQKHMYKNDTANV